MTTANTSDDETRAANTAKRRAARARRAVRGLPPDDPRHGSASAYANWRCRCDPCSKANAVKCASRRASATIEERQVTADNVGALYEWCEPSKLRYGPHPDPTPGKQLQLVGLTVRVDGVRTPALFGATIVHDGCGQFTVRPAGVTR